MRVAFALICIAACSPSKQKDNAAGSQTPTSPTPAPAVTEAKRSPDCASLVTAADIEAACKRKVESTAAPPTDAPIACHRLFVGAGASLDVQLTDFQAPKYALESLEDTEKGDDEVHKGFPELVPASAVIKGLGDAAYFREEPAFQGEADRSLAIVKGRWMASLTTFKSSDSKFACSRAQLEQLAQTVVAHMP